MCTYLPLTNLSCWYSGIHLVNTSIADILYNRHQGCMNYKGFGRSISPCENLTNPWILTPHYSFNRHFLCSQLYTILERPWFSRHLSALFPPKITPKLVKKCFAKRPCKNDPVTYLVAKDNLVGLSQSTPCAVGDWITSRSAVIQGGVVHQLFMLT